MIYNLKYIKHHINIYITYPYHHTHHPTTLPPHPPPRPCPQVYNVCEQVWALRGPAYYSDRLRLADFLREVRAAIPQTWHGGLVEHVEYLYFKVWCGSGSSVVVGMVVGMGMVVGTGI
jgi:hypothetical protein